MKLSSKDLLKIIREAAEEKKAYDVRTIEVSPVTVLTDYFVICTSDSNVQSRAIADHIAEKLEEKGLRINSREGYQSGDWVVMDARKVIVHIFTPEVREYYNIEKFWAEEIGQIQQGSSDNLSHLIKARKTAPAGKASKGKAATAKAGLRKPAAAAKGAAKASKTTAKPLTKKEQIEREILKKAAPPKKNVLAKEKPEGVSRRQQIEEEIIQMKRKREENRERQKAGSAAKKTSPAPVRPAGKGDAKKMRAAESFASKAKSKAGSMAALKSKKGAKK